MGKKTKQDVIDELNQRITGLEIELGEANSRKADLSEEKTRLEEALQYQKSRYEETFTKYIKGQMDLRSSQAAMAHWYKEAMDLQTTIIARGARRAEHDPEFAIIRELIHSKGNLSSEQVYELVKKHPEADLRRMVTVADEFGLELKFDIVPKDFHTQTWAYQSEDGKWKATMHVKEAVAYTPKEDGGQ